ncbi:MAG: MFS transporter, partial [Candidatus Nanopelagicales bacterium]|nr:MFS transporter [Candidatus Nanopelagicales bacterium]
ATGSGIWVSAAVALGFLPYVLFSTTAGMVADRYSRSVVLRWSIVLRIGVASVVTVGLVMMWPVPVLIGLAGILATLGTPAYPSLAAATPQLVRDDDLPAANTLATGIENAGWVAGPGLLGLLLLLGAPVAGGGLAAIACFGAALVCLGRLWLPPAAPQLAVGTSSAFFAGLRVVTRTRRLRMFMLLAVLDNALYGFIVVSMVFVGERALSAGETGIGLLNAMFAVGAFASMIVAPRLAARNTLRWLAVTLGLFVAWAMVLSAAPSLWVAATAVFFAGLFTVVAEIIAVTTIQQRTANAVASRVFGLYDTVSILAITITTALAGTLTEVLGVRLALFSAAVVTGVLAGVSILTGLRVRTMVPNTPGAVVGRLHPVGLVKAVRPLPASLFGQHLRAGLGGTLVVRIRVPRQSPPVSVRST